MGLVGVWSIRQNANEAQRLQLSCIRSECVIRKQVMRNIMNGYDTGIYISDVILNMQMFYWCSFQALGYMFMVTIMRVKMWINKVEISGFKKVFYSICNYK